MNRYRYQNNSALVHHLKMCRWYVVYVIDVGHTTDHWLVDCALIWRSESVLRDRKIDNGTFSVGKEFMTAEVV